MKVMLVNPCSDSPAFVLPNLGLGYIAASLKRDGHEVVIADCPRDRITLAQWPNVVASHAPDVVGIQVFTCNYANVCEMIRIVKARVPSAITVCGGPHATAAPDQTLLENPALDFVIMGEGEKALCDLLKLKAFMPSNLSTIANLAWRDGADIRKNPRYFVEDLDTLPDIEWSLFEPRSYPLLPHGVLNKAWPIAPIIATRGCPFSCRFCSAGLQMGRRLRTRSPARVVDEMEHLVKNHGVREIHFEDDNLTYDRFFVIELCREIISRNLRVAWACPNGVRLDRLDPEVVRLMEASGCYSFAVGIESGSERVLRQMGKGLTPRYMMDQLKMIKAVSNIKVTGFFLCGHPGETLDDLEMTERFVMEAPLDRISLSPFMPLPGTKDFYLLKDAGLLPEYPDWARLMNYRDRDYRSFCDIPAAELLGRLRRLSFRFYLRPRVMLSVMRRVHSLSQVRVMMRFFAYLLGFDSARYW